LGAVPNIQAQKPNTVVVVATLSNAANSDYEPAFLEFLKAELGKNNIGLEVVALSPQNQPPVQIMFGDIFDNQGQRIIVGTSVSLQFDSPLDTTSPVLENDLVPTPAGVGFTGSVNEAASIATGLIAYSLGQCDIATQYFDRFNDENINAFYTDFYRGNCALMDGEYETAIHIFASIYHPDGPAYTSVVTNLAWAYLQVGQQAEAIQALTDFLDGFEASHSPKSRINGLVKRSQIYALAFEFSEAVEDLDEAIEITQKLDQSEFGDSQLAKLYFERAQRILLTYEWDDVLADYNTALELDPDYAEAYYHRGVLFYTQGPREEALPDFERYLELEPAGEWATEAADYIESIEIELEALGE
jgi:lipoprotein NlpI